MPIGKNSIKRVANNGYSKVASAAPDMDNSTVAEVITEAPAPEVKCAAKAPAAKAPTGGAKSAGGAKKSTKTAPVPKKEEKPTEKGYYNFGDELPIYLL